MSRATSNARGHWGARLKVLLVAALAALLLAPVAQVPARERDRTGDPPKLDAKSWILIEQRSGDVLTSNSVDEVLPMASTTKLMTAYLAIQRLDPSRVVRVGYYPADPVESVMGLEPGQKVSVRDLLHGLIMLSGNDAAVALAKAVSGTVPRFVRLMNRTAARLGLDQTGYRNPIGLDAPGHLSSAGDLAKISRALMRMPRFRAIAGDREALLTSYRPPLEITTPTDVLRSSPCAKGIKTGATNLAGYILASAGEKRGVELIGVVMGTSSELARDSESARLLEWGFSLYRERVPLRRGTVAAEVPIRFRDPGLELVPGATERVGLRKGQVLEVRLNLPDEVEGPIRRGLPIGRALVLVDGERVAEVPLLAANPVSPPTAVEEVRGFTEERFFLLGLLLFAILLLAVVFGRRRDRKAREAVRRIGRKRS
ncbi:MAG: D-alanyl-D-alanine carboxypeptidase family protein [Solirubrobacterales bacterium]